MEKNLKKHTYIAVSSITDTLLYSRNIVNQPHFNVKKITKRNKIPKTDRLTHGFRVNFKVFLRFLFVLFCLLFQLMQLASQPGTESWPLAVKGGSPSHQDASKLPVRSSFGITLYWGVKKPTTNRKDCFQTPQNWQKQSTDPCS